MNILDWLARNTEFLSISVISEIIQAFNDLYQSDNETRNQAFIYAKHGSSVMQTVLT